jgi:hypothetical protein
LAWADAHRARTGQWPTSTSGEILEAEELTWLTIHLSLKDGLRGLPGGTTLARFLVDHGRGRNRKGLPSLMIEDILKWADEHRRRTGQWPKARSGPIAAAPGETWMAVQIALQQGRRGLPGGTTLPRLLAEHRGVANHLDRPALTVACILTGLRLITCALEAGPVPTPDPSPRIPAKHGALSTKLCASVSAGLLAARRWPDCD